MYSDDDYPMTPLPGYREVVSPISEEVPSSFEGGHHRSNSRGGSRFTINGYGGDGDYDHSDSSNDKSRSADGAAWRLQSLSATNSAGSLDEMLDGGHVSHSMRHEAFEHRANSAHDPYRSQAQNRLQQMPSHTRSHIQQEAKPTLDPSVPAFNPTVPAFRPVKFGQAFGGASAGANAGSNKSRLPVFSQLQSMDSGSDRGSSRRSDRSSPTNSIDSLTNSMDSMQTDGSVAPRLLIRELTQKMGSKDESKAAAAAKKVFDIVRESCPTWRQNQTEICRSPEMLITLAGLLRAGSERCRYEACRALGNIAFQNPGALGQALPAGVMNASGAADALATDICYMIVSSVGMLDGLKYVLRTGTCNSKHEAARVINNCAAYSGAAAELMVNYHGLVDCLKALCGQSERAQRTRAKAVGALNCLSTYETVRPVLLHQKVVEEALLPALAQRKKTFGDGDEFKAMRADAVMASANLVGKQEYSVLASEPDAFKTVMKCLKHGLEGQVWAGVTWTAYSALLPLSNLTVSDSNKPILLELGLVVLLFRVLGECLNKVEIELALECLDNLVFSEDCRKEMLRHNAMVMLPKAARMYGMGDDGLLVRKRVQRILWMLSKRGESHELRQLQHQHARPTQGRHIFLSYASTGPEIPEKVNLIREALDGSGFRVFCRSGSEIDEVAEAISVSSFFVVFASRAYKESCECRSQASYAEEARKAIIVVTMDSEVDRNYGWLFQLATGKMMIDFISAPTEGSHPSIMRVVNVAMQWIGAPPPRQSPAVSPDVNGSPSIRPQVPVKVSSGGIAAVTASSSPQIRAQVPISAGSPQIRAQAQVQAAGMHGASPMQSMHVATPPQNMHVSTPPPHMATASPGMHVATPPHAQAQALTHEGGAWA